jgi:hypothetical protein
MNRTFLFLAAVAVGTPAFADNILTRDPATKAQDKREDAQKDINQGVRKAHEDELEAQKAATGDTKMQSLDVELRNKLGDDWTIKKSGNGWLATRVTPKKTDTKFTKKMNDQEKDFRDSYKDASISRTHDEVMLRGRIDDCGDAAKAANDFAGIDGINKIYVDLSCANK